MRAELCGSEYFYLKHGKKLGNNVPLLVLHGGPGLDHSYLRPWLDALGDGAEVIYLDALGCGKSLGKQLLEDHSLAAAAASAEALRLHLKVDRWVVLGHGFGGFVAQQVAIDQPQHTAGLILCDATAALDYPQALFVAAQAAASAPQLQALVSLLRAPVADDSTLRRLYMEVLPSYFYRYDPKVGAAMTDGMKFCAQAYNRGMFHQVTDLNFCEQLGALQVPALVLAGRHDYFMPAEHGAQRLHTSLRNSSCVIFEESGHFPFVEEPIGFAKVVRSWLRSQCLRT
jgi:proline iminopeptidase